MSLSDTSAGAMRVLRNDLFRLIRLLIPETPDVEKTIRKRILFMLHEQV